MLLEELIEIGLGLLEIGLIDASWTNRFGPELAARLQQLIDTPEQ